MKRLLLILVIVGLLVVGCGSGGATRSPDTPTPSPTPPSTSTETPPPPPASELLVHFIDVGQGDAVLIDLGETEVLIDGGGKSPGVVDYLNDYVDGPLEAMVATHPHADHIGGLIEVLEAFEVKEMWHNGDTHTSKTYKQFMEGAEAEGSEVNVANLHDVIEAGGISIYVHHPAAIVESTNNNSIVLHLQYGEIDFLFTGDAEQEAEGQMMMLSSVRVPEVEILKVGHHASITASSLDFLQITSPKTAIYMCKEGNSYGHPHQETIDKLSDIGAEIYGTDKHGTIIVTTDGNDYTVETEKRIDPDLKLELSILDSSDNEIDSITYGESMKFQMDITNDTEDDISVIYYARPVKFTVYQSGNEVWHSYRIPFGIYPAPSVYAMMVYPANETTHDIDLWDITDMDFNPVSTGTYTVKAVFTYYIGNLEDENSLVPCERELMSEFYLETPPPNMMNPDKYTDNIAMSVEYLKAKYNPELQLMRESEGGPWTFTPPWEREWIVMPPWSGTTSYAMENVYWLGDSAVSMMALQLYEPAISEAIEAKLNSSGYKEYASSDKPDTLLGNTIDGPPPKQERKAYVAEKDGEYVVIGGQRIDEVLPDIENYADVLLQYSIQAWRAGDKQQARTYLRQVLDMWDGEGLWDLPATRDGEKHEAAIYKLALLLITLQVISEPFDVDDFNKIEARLWENQDEETGGIKTGIGPIGSVEGGPNTETTVLVLLAYDKDRIEMLGGE